MTVNTVTPGFIATEMVEAMPEKVIDKIKGRSRCDDWAGPKRSHASCISLPPSLLRVKPGQVPSARDSRIRRLGADVFAKIDFR